MDDREEVIQFILNHLDDPVTLVEPEFQEWLRDRGHRELFEEIRNQREAFMRWLFDDRIDVDREYRRLEAKLPSYRNTGLRRWGMVAACAIAFFTVSVFLWQSRTDIVDGEQLAVFEGKKSAELILADGKRINLENNVLKMREINGMLIVNDSHSLLSYQQDTLLSVQALEKELVYNTIAVPAGADYMVVLADGTKVRLNCGTRFRFPVAFAMNERKVFLDGEAFFEVKNAQELPFVVETSNMKVRVTGTSFNVKSYSTEELVHTTLVTGIVEVGTVQDTVNSLQLSPSQQFSLNKRTNRVEVKDVDVNLFTGWTEGMFVFKNERLEEVMNTLARWYTVEVFYTSTSVKDLRLSANLGRYEHIDSLLDVIRAMDKVNIERKGNVVTISRK